MGTERRFMCGLNIQCIVSCIAGVLSAGPDREGQNSLCSFREKSLLAPHVYTEFHVSAHFLYMINQSEHKENTGPRLPCTRSEQAPRAHMKLP